MPHAPLTGVGYYTLEITRALLTHVPGIEVRAFASAARFAPKVVCDLAAACASARLVRWPTRLKIALWTHIEWPPIERFTGAIDVAHGAFHLLPATRHAPRLVTVFDLTNFRYPEAHLSGQTHLHRTMLRHAVRRADALVAISKSAGADLVELLGADESKVRVVYGGVMLDEFSGDLDRAALDKAKGRFGITRDYFIHLGTLEPRKNVPRLLEAYARVRERRADCPQLVLTGKAGWLCEPIFETIEARGLHDAVVCTGYIDRAEAVLLLRGARACVYPSLYEGFGLPVLEAMAAGVPVMTSNVSSLPEVAGDTGILVNPEDVDALVSGIEQLIDDESGNAVRVSAARARAATFTWADSAAALASVYRWLAG